MTELYPAAAELEQAISEHTQAIRARLRKLMEEEEAREEAPLEPE